MSDLFIPRALGITGSLFLSGFAFSASYYTLPAAALAPLPLRLQQWLVVYDLGKLISPPVSAISALCYFYTSYALNSTPNTLTNSLHTSNSPQLYATAGAITLGVVIWTLVFMRPTNNALMAKAKIAREDEDVRNGKGRGGDGEKWALEAEGELGRWSTLNYVRAVIPLVGAWVGLYAAMK